MRFSPIVKRRKDRPASIRLTSRDVQILETIYTFDGIMSLKQVDRLFFSGEGRTWPRERMRALFHHGFITMPERANLHRVPYDETVYFLDAKGAETVASLYGKIGKDLKWRKKPRWSLISHDLAVNDFRIAIIFAAQASRKLSLQTWIPESEFWSNSDRIKYRSLGGAVRYRRVRPDGFFTIRRPVPSQPGTFEQLAFLLEIDMGTEDNPRFAREKVRPGVAYLKSPEYHRRFGVDYGRWLVVTTGAIRLENMKTQTEKSGGSNIFYFTTFDKISPKTVFSNPIWHRAGSGELTKIIADPRK